MVEDMIKRWAENADPQALRAKIEELEAQNAAALSPRDNEMRLQLLAKLRKIEENRK